MTNEELIKRFFRGRCRGDEESYGFSVKPLLRKPVGTFALYSKTSQFSMAVKVTDNYFLIAAPFTTKHSTISHQGSHNRQIINIAKQMETKYVLSPHADVNRFQQYMEGKINGDLATLARANSILDESPVLKPTLVLTKLYQNLMKGIRTLLEGEILLKLPKHQVVLLDTDEIQALWAWLIKKNPVKEDRELFLKIYTLSRLFSVNRKEEIDLGTVDISSL